MHAPDRLRRVRIVSVAVLNLLYAGMISSLALTPTPPHFAGTDWMQHGVAFGVQAVLLHGFLRNLLAPARSLAVAAAGAIVYGLAIELLQLAVPGRFFQASDLVANAAGVAVSVTAMIVAGRMAAGWKCGGTR